MLLAYPYATESTIDALMRLGDRVEILIDSGAFTAWKAGKPIALDGYMRFLESLPIKPWRYFALDVVHDPAATLRNYRAMLDRGLNPVPVFQRGESPAMLDEYFKTSDLVGIGGIVGTPGRRGYLRGIMQHAAGRHVHWLGFNDANFVKALRPLSVDVTTWVNGGKYGSIALYLGLGRLSVQLRRKHFLQQPSHDVMKCCERLGINWTALRRESEWHHGGEARSANIKSWIAYSQDVYRRLGTRVFLSIGSPTDVRDVTNAYNCLARVRAA
jgi:hypothetical protein